MEITRCDTNALYTAEPSVPAEGSVTASVIVSVDATRPNAETLDALAELDRGGLKAYDSVEELFRDLEAG
jgi:hypothetical protein